VRTGRGGRGSWRAPLASSPVTPRSSTRGRIAQVSAVFCSAVLLLGATAAAAAATPNEPGDPNNGYPGVTGGHDALTTIQLVLLFVIAPLVAIVIAAAFVLPRRKVGALAYRPGRPWGFEPEAFGAPTLPASGETRVSVPGLGGSSARW